MKTNIIRLDKILTALCSKKANLKYKEDKILNKNNKGMWWKHRKVKILVQLYKFQMKFSEKSIIIDISHNDKIVQLKIYNYP